MPEIKSFFKTPGNQMAPVKDQNSIVDEALRWVKMNSGYKLSGNSMGYSSPRISSEIMDCGMPLSFDHFNACGFGCCYCFSAAFKANNPEWIHHGGNRLRAVNIPGMIKAIKGEGKNNRDIALYEHFYSKKFMLHWGGLADPFCAFELNNGIGLPLMEFLGEYNYPTLFSFKGPAILAKNKPYINLFKHYAQQRNFAFQISMVTADDALAHKIEIGVPSPTQRLNMIKILSDLGYWTILRLRPYIIGLTDNSIDTLLKHALEAGIGGVSMEFFALDARSNPALKRRHEWMGKILGYDIPAYYSELSPTSRGTYRRLNRYVKELHVLKVYDFCVKNNLVFGCSDPDFKELSTTGNCCAMPNKYKPNQLLQNWTSDQLTYHLKEARRTYHTTGHKAKLTFDGVYSEKATWLNDQRFRDDHCSVVGMHYASIRTQVYIRQVIRSHWNNLASPSNPRNYFDGKVLPI
ncbi:hypothetical protein KKH13_04920, partial [Patescibacteria group bacterium]|nr:hypothetical protein [Patescibacteria group bacterium]